MMPTRPRCSTRFRAPLRSASGSCSCAVSRRSTNATTNARRRTGSGLIPPARRTESPRPCEPRRARYPRLSRPMSQRMSSDSSRCSAEMRTSWSRRWANCGAMATGSRSSPLYGGFVGCTRHHTRPRGDRSPNWPGGESFANRIASCSYGSKRYCPRRNLIPSGIVWTRCLRSDLLSTVKLMPAETLTTATSPYRPTSTSMLPSAGMRSVFSL